MFVLQLEAMRQLTLHTAWTMDRFGNKVRSFCFFVAFFYSFIQVSRDMIASIKIAVPRTVILCAIIFVMWQSVE